MSLAGAEAPVDQNFERAVETLRDLLRDVDPPHLDRELNHNVRRLLQAAVHQDSRIEPALSRTTAVVSVAKLASNSWRNRDRGPARAEWAAEHGNSVVYELVGDLVKIARGAQDRNLSSAPWLNSVYRLIQNDEEAYRFAVSADSVGAINDLVREAQDSKLAKPDPNAVAAADRFAEYLDRSDFEPPESAISGGFDASVDELLGIFQVADAESVARHFVGEDGRLNAYALKNLPKLASLRADNSSVKGILAEQPVIARLTTFVEQHPEISAIDAPRAGQALDAARVPMQRSVAFAAI